jgi:hypothetical protein
LAQPRHFSARESEVLLYVAGQRVNLLLASSPAALQIDSLSGSGNFASRILRRGSFITVKICRKKIVILSLNSFILPNLHFVSGVLLISLRQDESLDSPYLARSAKADAIMPFIP